MAWFADTRRSDEVLVREAVGGDLEAFDALVRRHRNLLVTRLLRSGVEPDEAEDVAQDAFLAAFAHLPQLREAGHFGSWLLSIARRRALARARGERRADALRAEVPAHSRGQEEAALIVARALEALPHCRRRALEMFAVEGREHSEIADALSRPPGTIRRWVAEARKRLTEEEESMDDSAKESGRGYLASNIMPEADVTRVFAALQEAGLVPAQFRDYDSLERGLRERPPAIIVLDEVVGDCGAFELLPLLKGREETRHVPVLMLGPGRERTVMAAWHAGVDCYLSKPFKQQELARFVQRMVEATTDALTGLLDRRALQDALHREGAEARRGRYRLTVCVLGLDWFQQLNQQFGREEGDRVVKAVAEALREAVGESGVVARCAGDEFAVVMPRVDGATAEATLARVGQGLRERSDLKTRVHLACGVASWEGEGVPEPVEMLRIAREEMLRDKLRPGGTRAED